MGGAAPQATMKRPSLFLPVPLPMNNYILNGSNISVASTLNGNPIQGPVGFLPLGLVGSEIVLKVAGPTGGIPTALPVGATNSANSQVTSTGTAATLVVARPTRTGCAIKNTDSANSVWIGKATVTTSNGYLLGPLDSVTVTWIGLIQIIDNGSHAIVSIWDEYA